MFRSTLMVAVIVGAAAFVGCANSRGTQSTRGGGSADGNAPVGPSRSGDEPNPADRPPEGHPNHVAPGGPGGPAAPGQ
jgi:hypothetical protein